MSIVDKLTAIANNVPQVYDAGRRHVIEKYFPEFTDSGLLVTCTPIVEYYPKVVSQLETSANGYSAITLTVCGKNLFEYTSGSFSNYFIYWKDGPNLGNTVSSSGFSCTDHIPVEHLRGQKLILTPSPYGSLESVASGNAGAVFYNENKTAISGSGSNGAKLVVPSNASYLRFSVPRTAVTVDVVEIQLELGEEGTEYEQYNSNIFSVNFTDTVYGGSFDWDTGILTDESGASTQQTKITIKLLDGINNIYSDTGETAVSGRNNPYVFV